MGTVFTVVIFWVFHRNVNIERLNQGFRHGQLAAAAFSLGHGANDAQKTMGIILALLIASGHAASDATTPLWVILAAHTAIGLEHAHRWMAHREDDGLEDHQAAARGGRGAESAAAVALRHLGRRHPVSTTHTITGAIVGVGAARRLSAAVRWGVAGRVV